ncbi:MAG: 4-phosphoerythronate dehydrogenase, partial [Endozoicomonas sp.]
DALLVRSVTRVDPAMVRDSSVRFIGSCTAGVDHVDLVALEGQDITFANAPGCNARSVVEYVLCALDILAERDGFNLTGRTVGIIGKGQVGGRLYETMSRLGVRVVACDPLCEPDPAVEFLDLDELIHHCDVIALHTPLTRSGLHPTHHLIGQRQLQSMKPGTVLVNAGRGPVVDNQALLECLKSGQQLSTVLDVWEHEPDVDPELLALVDIATPHIAGYSLDGKISGTEMVYKALCRCFGLPARVRPGAVTPIPTLKKIGYTDDISVAQASSLSMRAVYDIRRDDARMRKLLKLDRAARKLAFDQMRRNYAERREFGTLKVQAGRCSDDVRINLAALGFHLVD